MKTNIIDMVSKFNYFVGKTKNINNPIYSGFTIIKDKDNSDSGSVCGYCKKEETLLISMTWGFYFIEVEDALTYLSTMN